MELAPSLAVPVARRTPEWGWLEYLLQVSCQTSRIRLRAAWSVANRRLALECEQRCRGLLQLHAWVPVATLPETESIQDICATGFRTGHAGVSFHIGNVELPGFLRGSSDRGLAAGRGRGVRSRGRALPAGRRLYEFLLCRVGIGRSLLVESAEKAETMTLPPEYDSFFVRHSPYGDQVIDEEFPGVLPRHILHHEYIVRDAAQALPLYLVSFEYDPEAEEKIALPLCDNCGVQAALVYCEADGAQLCQACDARIHSSNSIAARHSRVELNRRLGRPLGHCPDHFEVEADLYCSECRTPLCPHCRSLGSHSTGEAAKHRLLPLLEAYARFLQLDKESAASRMPTRQRLEQKLLAELDGRLVLVQEAGQTLEDSIYDHVHEAVKQGQELAEEQAMLLLSDELEAQRQLEEAAWMERFFEEQVKSLEPPEFLDNWLRHCNAREEAAEGGEVPGLTSAGRPGATLWVEGNLRLVAEDSQLLTVATGGEVLGRRVAGFLLEG